MTQEEKITNFETLKHIGLVGKFINKLIVELLNRAEKHDKSKLETPELEAFTNHTAKLAASTYGSEEYEKNKNSEDLKIALQHHYAHNRHHPEHWKDGINDMNLVDLVEMFCDWKAASMRHNDGNINKSIAHNAIRFNMSPQLVRIFENTVDMVEND